MDLYVYMCVEEIYESTHSLTERCHNTHGGPSPDGEHREANYDDIVYDFFKFIAANYKHFF